MKALKVWMLICSTIIMLATLFFWTLFIPLLSDLEGAESMAQLVVFVPAMILFPIVFPLLWILETIYLFKLKQRKVYHYFFMILSCVVPILIGIIFYTMGMPILIFYILLSIISMCMVIMSLHILIKDKY
ncbi:hypothetical protein [Staphylococcus intermedius]|uniref:hypothetical protein n=1 Tax=Staphylococcus intermedius TaxID=1285 RepID=UPI000BBB7D36|nr:hypothetical protein [Staphylococcus intermedius]PCF89799.1 hypothetical protein B4W75_02860 [Staphylococcus intermedius]